MLFTIRSSADQENVNGVSVSVTRKALIEIQVIADQN
jgi:hypothetical protein